ncbi:S-layer homology domain-containing protein [Paenibacillus yanchengensis]|uniref:S-layer homology domain-containing protein n=1 Tax=Paenibacillus yanchengensis TaxID=2035833 RepID=A0ABW4YPB0_9BACL
MNKKNFIRSIVLTLSLILLVPIGSGIIAAKTSADFSDLKDLHANTRAKFDALLMMGTVDGISETNFGLKEEMNRAQFAKVAALVFNLRVDTSIQTSSFKDVQIDTPGFGYALPYIEAVRQAGITDGVGGGSFDPAGKVTKEQLATFLVRGLGLDKEVKSTPGVDDSTVSDWAKGYVDVALQLNLLNKDSEDAFGGNIPADRELLVVGAFESGKTLEKSQPLHAVGAHFDASDILNIKLSVRISPKSIDLSKIKINGIALDPELDSFELSEDQKVIIIKLHKGLTFDESSKMPEIDISDLKTLYGNAVHNEESIPMPVTVIESLIIKPEVTPTTDADFTPYWIPNSSPNPNPTPDPSPSPSPDPNPSQNPNPNPNLNSNAGN